MFHMNFNGGSQWNCIRGIMSDIGHLIYAFRSSLGVNQEQFGKMLSPHVQQETISKLEAGKMTPSKRVMGAILELAKQHNFPITAEHLFDVK